ncbi:MAG: tyrosine-type recombinase/integrase [Paracoccaceae bacterium]|nr:tyrosine-type recombinase/integrase [Paracoccaceae bacterium]
MTKHRRQYPGATAYFDRHGKRRWRFRRKGFAAELGTDYGSPEFERRYEAALKLQKVEGRVGASRTKSGTIDALVVAYFRSPKFRDLAPLTRSTYSNILDRFRREHGRKRVAHLQRRHVMDLMAERAETPTAANRLLKLLRSIMAHAVDLEIRPDNPTLGVKPFKLDGSGYHAWDETEIARFYEAHPLGTTAHLAMTLMLCTGAARADAVKLGWGNVNHGRLSYRRRKTRRQSNIVVDIPLHPDLAAALDFLPRSAFTFLQTEQGKSRSPDGLGNLMRKWCDAAGLPQCTSHGLRKACARRLAEAGATTHEIQAVTGHATLSEVERYTRAAQRSGLADAGFEKLDSWSKREQTLANHPKRFAKKGDK